MPVLRRGERERERENRERMKRKEDKKRRKKGIVNKKRMRTEKSGGIGET